MKRVRLPAETGACVPIHIWARAPSDEAIAQLQQLAAQPWVTERIAAMPDLHVANTVAVGTVFATDGVIVPSTLGGDLGCGMTAAHFDFPAASLSRRDLTGIVAALGRAIPVGDHVHRGRGVAV